MKQVSRKGYKYIQEEGYLKNIKAKTRKEEYLPFLNIFVVIIY
jgi:hypothetical protein